MKGRLKIINESMHPDDEVDALVRFGCDELEVTGSGLVALVRNTRRTWQRHGEAVDYAGTAYSLIDGGVPETLYDRYMTGKRDIHLITLRIGPPESFPITPFTRNGIPHDAATWQEALVAITAHEALHIQHIHDGAYQRRSGQRKIKPRRLHIHGEVARTVKVRIGVERIEPKAEAFERYMLERFRRNGTG